MNVASLDLCRELYELSGWDDCEDVYRQADPGEEDEKVVAPAYDLGYLLRKMPRYVDLSDVDERLGLTFMVVNDDQWLFRYDNSAESFRFLSAIADTPEDAAAKLCISLIKQGVIKPEGAEAHV